MLALRSLLALHCGAQEERPQITPGERKAAKKKDAGPRALGVLRMTPDGKVSLVPIAILVDGKFWDAGAYKADPVPMALDSGVVYEGERAGNSLGLFTVAGALHSNAVNAPIHGSRRVRGVRSDRKCRKKTRRRARRWASTPRMKRLDSRAIPTR